MKKIKNLLLILFPVIVFSFFAFSKGALSEKSSSSNDVAVATSNMSGGWCPGVGYPCFKINIAWGLVEIIGYKGDNGGGYVLPL